MATGYYIHKPSADWEAVERWENEGGRLNHGGKRDQISRAMFLASDKAKFITGQTAGVNGERVPTPRMISRLLRQGYASSNAS